MFADVVAIGLGVLVILFLAEVVVRSTIKIANHFGWTGTFVGLTVLSIGTSIPEIMSAIVGSAQIVRDPSLLVTMSGLIVGQNVGSDIFQQSFILALVGIIGTVLVVRKNLFKEIGVLIIGAVLVLLFSLDGGLSRVEGFIMVASYIGYLMYLHKTKKNNKVGKRASMSLRKVFLESGIIIVSFIAMAVAAGQVLERSTILIAESVFSASFFGVIVLGVASALPELTTAIVGALNKKKGISTGVLIGSNITNPLLGLGTGAFISSYSIPYVVTAYDLPFKIGTGVLIYYFLYKNKDLMKWQGAILLILFAVYLLIRQAYFPVDL